MVRMLKNKWTLFVSLSLICGGIILAASEINLARMLKEAQTNYEQGKYFDSYMKLRAASLDVWSKCPLTLHNVHFVVDEPAAFGMYNPRPNAVFKRGEIIRVYMEPIGFTIKQQGGFKQFSLSTDFNILDAEGNVLAGKRNFGTFPFKSRSHITQFMLNLTYTLTGAEPGKYKIETVVRDNFSPKRASIIQDIEIMP